MGESSFRKSIFQSFALVVLAAFSLPGQCRTEVLIHELPQSVVERVKYLGNGSFEVTLALANSPASGKPTPFFDGKYKLSFAIQADSLDGTLIENSTTPSGRSRIDSRLGGAEFVNLLISKALLRAKIVLSCGLLPPAGEGVEDPYQLTYFQVDGT